MRKPPCFSRAIWHSALPTGCKLLVMVWACTKRPSSRRSAGMWTTHRPSRLLPMARQKLVSNAIAPASASVVRRIASSVGLSRMTFRPATSKRQSLSLRIGLRRYSGLTNAFSKTVQNHGHGLCLHYFNYNWVRRHQALKTTPAVAAGLTTRRMLIQELVEHIEANEKATGGRIANYLPSPSN